MQRSGATPTQTAAPFFSSLFGTGTNHSNATAANDPSSFLSSSPNRTKSPGKNGRPATSSGEDGSPRQPNLLHKERDRDRDRRPSFGRKASFTSSSPSRGKLRANSSGAPADGAGLAGPRAQLFADPSVPPVPGLNLAATANLSRDADPALLSPASIDSFPKMLSRTAPTPANGFITVTGALAPPPTASGAGQPSELAVIHQHIQETANKRISTLDYLRKAHEGRVYWFNTVLFDKPDLTRMAHFDSRKLGRRATNYLLLGISLPNVTDLNSNNAIEFLRSLNTLLTEFDAFQQLHSENGAPSSSLSRARIPQMFRSRPGKGRRSSNANGMGVGAGGDYDDDYGPGVPGSSSASDGASIAASTSASIMNFTPAETDLLPGEEYTYLLTPSLPFDPDFFEVFTTLCEVLIDTYQRFLALIPTPQNCAGPVADLFGKADARVRKLLVQNVVREFEESSRNGSKAEVANVGKVVLSGLM